MSLSRTPIASQRLRRRRRTKIIATLGPASSTTEIITRLFQAGADVFRLNFSPWHARGPRGPHRLDPRDRAQLRPPDRHPGGRAGAEAARRPLRRRPGASADRPDLPARPEPDARRRRRASTCRIPRSSPPPPSAPTLLLDDGKLRLRVTRKRDDHLETEVVVGGALSDRKGVNVPDVVLPIPALTEKDRDRPRLRARGTGSTTSACPSCSAPRM